MVTVIMAKATTVSSKKSLFEAFLTSKVIFNTLRKAYEKLYLLKIWGIV